VVVGLPEAIEVVDLHLTELEVEPEDLGGEAGLREIPRVVIDARYPGAPLGQLERVEARVAADVEDRLPGQVRGKGALDGAPELVVEGPERMVWRGSLAVELEVVEPGPQAVDVASDFRDLHGIATPLSVKLVRSRHPRAGVPAPDLLSCGGGKKHALC